MLLIRSGCLVQQICLDKEAYDPGSLVAMYEHFGYLYYYESSSTIYEKVSVPDWRGASRFVEYKYRFNI